MENEYTFLLKQHIGIPAAPVVAKQQKVVRGELIAKNETGLGANIYSSVSGIVKEIDADKIVIKDTGTNFMDYKKLKSRLAFDLVKEAGIVGLGGAGFPTDVKLETKLSKKGTLIINAAECEPILSHNMQRIQMNTKDFLTGIELVLEMLQITHAVIGIKQKHEKTILMLEQSLQEKKTQADTKKQFEIKIFPLIDMYPMGEERALIREIKQILLKPDELPQQADCVVLNAETIFKIKEAVIEKKPLIDKDLTIAGKLKDNAATKILFDIPIGTSVAEVIKKAGGAAQGYGEIILGGSFTGKRAKISDPIQKTTGAILLSECFLKGPKEIGLLVCACGANETRMKELAQSMESHVCSIQYCKQAILHKGTYKCENPGHCPGQVQKIMEIKKAGATGVLIGNCSDCSNTVMSCAPKLGLSVYHITDGALRAVNHSLIRKLK